jgi:hypothetical protein
MGRAYRANPRRPPSQRRHYIMALRRGAYLKRGANYTEAATLLRCVRPDQSSATVRCHYLTDGTVNFALTMRRAEYFIPAGILLKCFLEVGVGEGVGGGATPGCRARGRSAVECGGAAVREGGRPRTRVVAPRPPRAARHSRLDPLPHPPSNPHLSAPLALACP